jgi:hypothetical protein
LRPWAVEVPREPGELSLPTCILHSLLKGAPAGRQNQSAAGPDSGLHLDPLLFKHATTTLASVPVININLNNTSAAISHESVATRKTRLDSSSVPRNQSDKHSAPAVMTRLHPQSAAIPVYSDSRPKFYSACPACRSAATSITAALHRRVPPFLTTAPSGQAPHCPWSCVCCLLLLPLQAVAAAGSCHV